MRYLLDTSAVLAHHRREQGWEAVQAIFESEDAEIFVASVTLTELGRRLRDLGANQEQAEQTIAGYQLLCSEVTSIDATVAHTAAAFVYLMPQRLPLVDTLIAAAAQQVQAVLVHRDRHMRQIPSALLQQQDLD